MIEEKTEKEFKIENYLQLYRPKDLSPIAIHPMTGVSNSFNNKIGLQTLATNQSHSIIWNVKLKYKHINKQDEYNINQTGSRTVCKNF